MNTDQTPKQVTTNKQYESLVYDIEEYIERTDYERTERRFLRQLESLESILQEMKQKEYERLNRSSSPRETRGMNPNLNDILQVILCFMIGAFIVQIFLYWG
jgi:molecular chaperone DnaK (HSP70)